MARQVYHLPAEAEAKGLPRPWQIRGRFLSFFVFVFVFSALNALRIKSIGIGHKRYFLKEAGWVYHSTLSGLINTHNEILTLGDFTGSQCPDVFAIASKHCEPHVNNADRV